MSLDLYHNNRGIRLNKQKLWLKLCKLSKYGHKKDVKNEKKKKQFFKFFLIAFFSAYPYCAIQSVIVL